MPSFLKEFVAVNNKVLHNKAGWRFYIAYVDKIPAGIGVLFRKGAFGMLAASATVPEFRNKGVHRALINRRVEDAKDMGCSFMVGQAAYGSVSQSNMEKAGMNITYTKSIWVRADNVV
ncbi:Predicted acetyltransferase, GNAT superfamily [Oceanobacillus limi]|uniref:Predicted acetyltransferase, GNAT superfamily n=1 Tax=Oceanobacillus limi TaxID=930131 RepID=A0A1I0B2T5_9BACI|nr:Predicted acetyltransferase, GNAT superfamily [Oceanobacillus limi]